MKRYVLGFFIGVWFVIEALYSEWGVISIIAYALMLGIFTTLYMFYEHIMARFSGK